MRVTIPTVLLFGALIAAVIICDGAGNSALHGEGVNGTQLCAEPVHRWSSLALGALGDAWCKQSGGPADPLYNYARNSDDWKGLCGTGTSQSPIDLSINNASFVRPIQNASHLVTFGTIAATGNAVMRLEIDEVELVSGNWNVTGLTIPVCGASDVGCLRSENATSVQYITPNMSNLHFHANSEHTREGLYYGAEAHLVANMSVNGKYHTVVFGVLMDLSGNQTNQFFSQLEPYFNNGKGEDCTAVDNVTFHVDTLFPSNKTYYAYSGSLTTPPCSEDVFWIIFTTPVKISVPQMKSLYEASAHIFQPCAPGSTNQICNVMGSRTNNRPLQPINGRFVSLGKIDSSLANN